MSLEDKLLESSFWGRKPEITDEIIEYYRNNPEELESLIDKSKFNSKFLVFIFILGISLTIAARILKYFFEGSWSEFIDRIILDVISEIGIAVFGGALTVYLLDHMKKKQYQESIRLKREIKRSIQLSDKTQNT